MDAELQITNESEREAPVDRQALERLAERVLEGELGLEASPLEVSLLYCDDPFIHELNARYRGKDAPTDVLAFAQDEPPPGGGRRALGDVVISLETVERRCEADSAVVRGETTLLFCHGLLHLLGYSHFTATECDAMARLQGRYLDRPASNVRPVEEGPAPGGSDSARLGGP